MVLLAFLALCYIFGLSLQVTFWKTAGGVLLLLLGVEETEETWGLCLLLTIEGSVLTALDLSKCCGYFTFILAYWHLPVL